MNSAVIDANIIVRAVLPTPSESELEALHHLIGKNVCLFAPDLWKVEVTSALRRYEYHQLIRQEEADLSLEDAFALPIESVAIDSNICQQALGWARQLGQSKAYDGLYLAVAQNRSGDLWTADQRLWRRCKDLKLSWVKFTEQEKSG